jgi:hypothetical protein
MKKGQKRGAWKDILTKEFIEHQHFVLRKSTDLIGAEIGAAGSTVERYGKSFGITFLKDALKKGRKSSSATKFKPGMTPWNKGLTGIKCGPIGQIRPRGNLHFNWKGGKRDRDTIEYKTWRKSVFEQNNYTCQHCQIHGVRLNAHHVKPWSKFIHLRYEPSNGITLCVKCHKKIHSVESGSNNNGS